MADEGELPRCEMGQRLAPKLQQDRRMSLRRKYLPTDETCGQWGTQAGAMWGRMLQGGPRTAPVRQARMVCSGMAIGFCIQARSVQDLAGTR